MTIALADVVAEARSWLSTPYQHQARVKGIGVDCVGLPLCNARALGIVAADFDITGYSRQPDGTLIEQCDRWMARVPLADMQPGHVIVLRTEALPNHFGIVADYVHGGLSIIHALLTRSGRGKVIEQRLSDEMRARIVGVYNMPGVA